MNNIMWEKIAEYCKKEYAVYVNFGPEERYFICPECNEPIYEEDWLEEKFDVCPICNFEF